MMRPLSENRSETLDSAEQIPADIMREAQYLARYAVAGLPFVTEAALEAQVSFSAPAIARALHARDKRAAEIATEHARTFRKMFAHDCARAVEGVRDAILSPAPAVSSPGCGTSEAPAPASYSTPPGTHLSAAADGQPSVPSSARAGAKREDGCICPPGRGDSTSRIVSREAEQAVTHSHSSRPSSSATDKAGEAPPPVSPAANPDEAQP